MNIATNKEAEIMVYLKDNDIKNIIEEAKEYILDFCKAKEITYIAQAPSTTEGISSSILDRVNIYIPLKNLIDMDAEKKRLEKALAEYNQELGRAKKKLSNEGFLKKAPLEVIEKEKEKELLYSGKIKTVDEQLKNL